MKRVLALHGFTGAPESFDALRAELGADVELLTPSIAGHGPNPVPAVSFEREIDRLVSAIPTDGPLVVFGYSLGGRLALGLLARFPTRFRAALIVSANPGLSTEAERIARRASDDALAAELREHGIERFLHGWESGPMFASQAALPSSIRDARRVIRRTHREDALADSLSALSLGRMPDFRSAIALRSVPTTFVAGERDAKFVALAEECASLAATDPILVAGVGHDVLLERPELIAELIRRMVRDIA